MTHKITVRITPMQGDPYTAAECEIFEEARGYCRYKIPYSDGRVKRVEIVEPNCSNLPVWDASWDSQTNYDALWGEPPKYDRFPRLRRPT